LADPAWDLLLDLFIAGEERRRVSVTSACIAAAVPPTTGLRWINLLEDQELIERGNDPDDGRKVYLSLTSTARSKVVEWLERFGAALK
jgi:DNA-binding MarR family transcriptional regulator